MDRKGDLSTTLFTNLFDIIIVCMVLLALLAYVTSYEENTILEKNYLSRDISLMINTIYSIPYQISERYNSKNIDLMDFDLSFQGTNFYVQEAQDKSLRIYYPFGKDTTIDSQFPMISGSRDIYFNKGSTFSIDESVVDHEESCGSIDTSGEINTKNILLKAIDADVWKGAIFKDTEIIDDIIGDLKDYKGWYTDNSADPDMIIEVSPGTDDPTVIPVHAYYYMDNSFSKESRKLACILTSRFPDNGKYFYDKKIIPISGSGDNKVQVKLVIGNVMVDKKINGQQVYFPNRGEISEAINNAITRYYG